MWVLLRYRDVVTLLVKSAWSTHGDLAVTPFGLLTLGNSLELHGDVTEAGVLLGPCDTAGASFIVLA